MFRVYSQEFYDNKSVKEQFENRYISCLVKKAKNAFVKENISDTESYSLYDFCNINLDILCKNHTSICLPKNFEELLILSPRAMAEIVIQFWNDTNFSNDVENLICKRIWRNGATRNTSILLDYDYFSDEIAQHFLNNEDEEIYTINTCFYCNRAYINSYETTASAKKRQFDLDHFIPKSECPLFALSLYNFVPSCQVCNSRIKNSGIYYKNISAVDDLKKIFPTSVNYNYDEALTFRIVPCKKLYWEKEKFGEFKDIPESFAIEFEQKDNGELYKSEADAFDIINRYKHHKKEFLSYIDKLRKYPASYFLMLAQKTSISNATELHEAIFDTKLRNEQKMIFQKIYNDIDSNI